MTTQNRLTKIVSRGNSRYPAIRNRQIVERLSRSRKVN